MGSLKIEMLAANQGDAIWVEWGEPGEEHVLLVDGGLQSTFKNIRSRFEKREAEKRHVELLVVSHIDWDHIIGALHLLHDNSTGLTFSDIWFNDYHHITEASRGALQGEYLSALLAKRELPWNEAFDGASIHVPPEGPCLASSSKTA